MSDPQTTLNKLSPQALGAAMRGGTEAWGQWGSSIDHVRYAEPITGPRRRICRCGCRKRSTFRGAANGVTLVTGCEFRIRRWVRDGR